MVEKHYTLPQHGYMLHQCCTSPRVRESLPERERERAPGKERKNQEREKQKGLSKRRVEEYLAVEEYR